MNDLDGVMLVTRTTTQTDTDGVSLATTLIKVQQPRRLLPMLLQAIVGGALVGSIIVNILQAYEIERLKSDHINRVIRTYAKTNHQADS